MKGIVWQHVHYALNSAASEGRTNSKIKKKVQDLKYRPKYIRAACLFHQTVKNHQGIPAEWRGDGH